MSHYKLLLEENRIDYDILPNYYPFDPCQTNLQEKFSQYYLAALADQIWLDPEGLVWIDGFSNYRNFYREGLEKLETNQNLDVIVLDVKMPGMDGLEMLKKIKSGFYRSEVIMLTGHATIESGITGMKLGAFDFLTKPCDIEELVSKIEEATKKKREHDSRIADAERKKLLRDYEP